MDNKVVSKLLERFNKLSSERRNIENIWQDIADYYLPHSLDITRKNMQPVTTNTQKRFSDIGVKSVEYLASAVFGGTTNPTMKWFGLGTKGPQMEDIKFQQFLEYVSDTMLKDVFNSSESEFPLQVHEFLLSLYSFGTACMIMEEDVEEQELRFKAIPITEIYLGADKYGSIDTVFRKTCMTGRQIIQKWGEAVHENIIKESDSAPDKRYDILHVCIPKNESMHPSYKDHEYVSYYIDIDNEHLMSQGGYFESPYFVARCMVLAGETYGRSPAWHTLNDIKMVSKMWESVIRAGQLQSQPPIMVADDGVMMPLKVVPNGIIVGGVAYDGTERVRPLNVGGQLVITLQMIEAKEKSIRDAFYIDNLVMRDGPMMTATEVMQRQQESMRLLGPLLGRYQVEFLSPLIEKVFSSLARAGKFGKIDPKLLESEYEIEYTSPLTILQKTTEVQKFSQFLQFAMGIAQVNPQALDIIDFDRAMAQAADSIGIWKSVQRSPEELQAMRDQQAQAQQAQMALNAGNQVADSLNKLSPLIGGNGQ